MTKDGHEFIVNRNPGSTHVGDKLQCHLLDNYKFYWSQVWDPFRAGKKTVFIWSIWHKTLSLMNGGPVLRRFPFLSNKFFDSRTLASQLSISFGIIYKLEGCDVGLFTLCINICGVRTGNYDNFN